MSRPSSSLFAGRLILHLLLYGSCIAARKKSETSRIACTPSCFHKIGPLRYARSLSSLAGHLPNSMAARKREAKLLEISSRKHNYTLAEVVYVQGSTSEPPSPRMNYQLQVIQENL